MVCGALMISLNVSPITANPFNGLEFKGLTWFITNFAFPTGSAFKTVPIKLAPEM